MLATTSAQARREQPSSRLTTKAGLSGGTRKMSRGSWCRSTWPISPSLVFDDLAFFLDHGAALAVEPSLPQPPVDRRGRRWNGNRLLQGREDLVAVEALAALRQDLGVDPRRLAALAPFRPAPARRQILRRAALQIAVVISAEGLKAGAVVAVERADAGKMRRPPRLHRLLFRNQETPLLQIVALDRPVIAVVTHRSSHNKGAANHRINEHAQQ